MFSACVCCVNIYVYVCKCVCMHVCMHECVWMHMCVRLCACCFCLGLGCYVFVLLFCFGYFCFFKLGEGRVSHKTNSISPS